MEYDLVFEGGGAKGMVFVGAMEEFEQRGHTYKRLLGTSAGAITAALLAAGYTAQEMLEALAEKEDGRSVFSSFLGQPGPFEKAQVLKSATLQFLYNVDIPLLPDFLDKKLDELVVKWLAADPKLASSYSFLEFGGLYSARSFIAWMKQRMDSGMHRGKQRHYSEMTLKEFYDATGSDLTLVAADTSGAAMLVLNHRTAPQLPVVWAVRMSMSIPLLWQEVVWLEEWGLYRGREMAGHTIVDGGMLSNFPIELFVSQDDYVKNLMGSEAGEGVLGMLIDESQPVKGLQMAAKPESASALSKAPLLQRVSNLLNTSMSAHDKMVTENFERLVVRLPANGYGTTEFEMSDEKRGLLVQAGRETMKAYFESQDFGEVAFGLEGGEGEAELARQADRVARKMLGQ
jgi:predicted acylesterase/phospholipase RssA